MPNLPQTYLEIDLSALKHNYLTIKKHLKQSTKIMAVVKSNAYGSDALAVSKYLEHLGIDYFAVAYTEEAVFLRLSGITKPIVVFYPQLVEFNDIIKYKLIPSAYDIDMLKSYADFSTASGLDSFSIHLNINTGMNRLGINTSQFDTVKNIIKNSKTLSLSGVFSHFSAPGLENEREFTINQIKRFKEAVSYFMPLGDSNFITHLSNSSGLIHYREADMDMVRVGITLFGYGKNASDTKLKPISTLKTEIIQLRWIEEGESVGYDRKFKAKRRTKVATIPLGYVDGISRLFGNSNAQVLLNGNLIPIIGNVCMDTLMLDVTGLECHKGDEIIVFGKTHPLTAFDYKGLSIPYELMCRIPKRIKRVIVNEYYSQNT